MSAKLCGTCGKRPAVTHYRDKMGAKVRRALRDHEECRQCHRSRTDRDCARPAMPAVLMMKAGLR